jgi:hypothetical protein
VYLERVDRDELVDGALDGLGRGRLEGAKRGKRHTGAGEGVEPRPATTVALTGFKGRQLLNG